MMMESVMGVLDGMSVLTTVLLEPVVSVLMWSVFVVRVLVGKMSCPSNS